MKDKEIPLCSDLCKHCVYIESGDFICDVTDDVTIVDWKSFSCCCLEKRRLANDRSKIN